MFFAVYLLGLTFVLRGFGLLGTCAAFWVSYQVKAPLTLDASSWYFPASCAAMIAMATLGFWAYRSSVGHRLPGK